MSDLYLQNGDIYVSPTGTVRLTGTLLERAAQRLKIKFQFFLGEWFLDTSRGIPYYRDILGKTGSDISIIREIFRGVALKDEDVVAVPKMEVTLDGRALRVETDIVLVDRTILTLSFPEPAVDSNNLLVDEFGNVLIDDEGNILTL